MKRKNPLISCICVTSNRPVLLQRALACYERQDYPNKELVISYPENDQATRSILDQIEELSTIKMVRIERLEQETLGAARNNAIAAANGEFICIWDDDDWCHSSRISHQYMAIKNGPFKASVLMQILMYDTETQEAYCSPYQNWEGTLLCERKFMLESSYLDLQKGEDTYVMHYLSSRNVLFHILEVPYLYIYIYHGNNTWGEAHFHSYFLQGMPLDKDSNGQIKDIVSLEYYSLTSS